MGSKKMGDGLHFIRVNDDGTEEHRSWEQVDAEARERRRAMLAGEYAWGRWRFNPDVLCLELYDEHDNVEYQVDLERCTTSAATLDWICQVKLKSWADDEVIAGLVRGLDDLLHPQQTLCGQGIERGPLDVAKELGLPTRPAEDG
jgi:hypothetical protein